VSWLPGIEAVVVALTKDLFSSEVEKDRNRRRCWYNVVVVHHQAPRTGVTVGLILIAVSGCGGSMSRASEGDVGGANIGQVNAGSGGVDGVGDGVQSGGASPSSGKSPGHFDAAPSVQSIPGESFHQVWGTTGDLWILGTTDEQPTPMGPKTGDLYCGADRYVASNVLRRKTSAGFEPVDQPSSTTLTSLHGSGATDVWMVGLGGAVFQFDGDGWHSHDIRQAEGLAYEEVVCSELSLLSVFARNPSDVWIVGYIYSSQLGPGLILHYDGEHWQRHAVDAPDGFFDVWASSASNAWAVGSSGLVYHYDGAAWRRTDAGTDMYLFSVLGTAADDVWAVGNQSVTTHFDGMAWQLTDPGQGYSSSRALASNGQGLWKLVTSGDTLEPSDWRQSVSQWDGLAWSDAFSTTDQQQELRDLYVTPEGQLWGVGRNVVRFR
jgi:hypothetical protein